MDNEISTDNTPITKHNRTNKQIQQFPAINISRKRSVLLDHGTRIGTTVIFLTTSKSANSNQATRIKKQKHRQQNNYETKPVIL